MVDLSVAWSVVHSVALTVVALVASTVGSLVAASETCLVDWLGYLMVLVKVEMLVEKSVELTVLQ
jgi:hypothetical protein